MTSKSALNLYLVDLGEVTPATAETEWDGVNSILVAAASESDALGIADAYCRDEVAPDNMTWGDQTISVVRARD